MQNLLGKGNEKEAEEEYYCSDKVEIKALKPKRFVP